jgi:hypothetical protein
MHLALWAFEALVVEQLDLLYMGHTKHDEKPTGWYVSSSMTPIFNHSSKYEGRTQLAFVF